MVNQVAKENNEAEGLGMGNLVDVAYGIHEGLAGDLNGSDESEDGDLEPPYVLEPDLEFEPNVPQATTRQEVDKNFPQKFRSAKYAFRKEILRKCKSVEEAIAACLDGKDLNHWAAFVRNESTVEVRARNAKIAENAKKNIY
ncbi:hypothetical protein IFM89_022048 [Coptis chinensis]|uniref:Transposase n=1 Tax=Coptis chinensis TaxID=261450 RepID=A0A835I6Y4_9MAGN|nr:hypothetical protein IFM89_022048 [Coptis chinensis]